MSPFRRRSGARAARGWVVALLLIGALPCVRVEHAQAQSFTATTVAGLIAAITAANGNGQMNTIALTPGASYTLTAANNGAPGDETGLPRITSNLTITGNGAIIERSSAAQTPHFRIFAVNSGGALALSGLTIRNGSLAGVVGVTHAAGTSASGESGGGAAGGAILVAGGGSLSATNSLFTANSATGGVGGDGSSGADGSGRAGSPGGNGGSGGSAGGGAISNGGALTLSGTTFAGNSATGGAGGSGGAGGNGMGAPGGKGGNAGAGASGAGGALLNSGTLTVSNTTFTANSVVGGAGGNGGAGGSGTGIPVAGAVGNGGNGSGGAIDQSAGSMLATNVTIARNSATGGAFGASGAGSGANGIGTGGGLYNDGGGVTITNTLLATNSAGNGNCGGNTVGDGGNNLDFNPSATCHLSVNAQNGDPGLGTLANHGGTTPTLDIAPGGVAAGAGNPVSCAGAPVGGVDQRGLRRSATQCSIGAFEPQALPFPTLAAISSGAGGLAGGSRVALTGTGFLNGATVTFGGAAATNVGVADTTTLTATTPAHAVGTVDVVVTNPDGQAATLGLSYTFSVVAPLPSPQPPGSPGGVPGPLPVLRPPGTSSGGTPPNPLPSRR